MASFKNLFFTLKEFPRTLPSLCCPRTHILNVFLFSRSYLYGYSPSSEASAVTTVAASGSLLSSDDAFSSVTAAEIISLDPAHELQTIRDLGSCDIYDGAWVLDQHVRPPYPPGSCPFLDDAFNYFKNRRLDSDYLMYRWKPHACQIPGFDGLRMLRLLRGKRIVFVGDSLNRNMWQSLVCFLRESLKDKTKVSLVSARRELRTQGFHSSRFQLSKSENHDADVIIFNTGHWWNHHKTRNGFRRRNYFQEGEHVYDRLDVKVALSKALKTWAKWVDSKVDRTRRGAMEDRREMQWGERANKERDQPCWGVSIVEKVMAEMKTPVLDLNISKMTEYRKDGHPSLYRGLSPPPRATVQDCSHWCLPGIPTSWTQLLDSTLLPHHHHASSK